MSEIQANKVVIVNDLTKEELLRHVEGKRYDLIKKLSLIEKKRVRGVKENLERQETLAMLQRTDSVISRLKKQ